jgi:ATP-dependent Clp protease adaptor protein ClpS
MSQQEKKPEEADGSTATMKPKVKEGAKKSPSRMPPKLLPQWKVLLHNDDKNDIVYVVVTIIELMRFKEPKAIECTKEAHLRGLSLLTITHKEKAELLQEQFQSKGLTVTIEPVE